MPAAKTTLLPLAVLSGSWKIAWPLPTFETLGGRIGRATAIEETRPLISADLEGRPGADAPSPAALAASRWTTDDPARALLAARSVPTTLVVNLVDPEPDVPLQLAWAMSQLDKLAVGIDAASGQCNLRRVMICVQATAPGSVLTQLKQLCVQRPVGTKLVLIPPRYPSAAARLLRHQVARRDRSCVVLDAVVMTDLAQLALKGTLPTLVPVAVHDPAIRVTHYRLVERGTSVKTLLKALELDWSRATLRAGASLRDVRCDAEMTLGNGELVIHVHGPASSGEPEACTRCGWCAEVCPVKLSPADLFAAAGGLDAEGKMAELGRSACVDCGLCTVICPSQLPLHRTFSPAGGTR
jgi:Na+-translocating ferredoxin:NAD+ oxidoreductase subunit C